MTYHFSGTLNLDDYVTFNREYRKYYYFHKTKGKFTIILFGIAFLLFTAGFVRDILTNESFQITPSFWMELFFVTFLLLVLRNIFFSKRKYSKYFSSNKLLSIPHTFAIDEHLIKFSTDKSSAQISKDMINQIIFGKKGVYIFISLTSSYIVPFHFFRTESEFESFREFMAKNYT